MPLWGGMMGPAFQESFYGEFRRMVLEEAVNRNNAEGRTCITGELTAQGLPLVLSVRRKHRGQGLCYVPDHRTPGRHCDFYRLHQAGLRPHGPRQDCHLGRL